LNLPLTGRAFRSRKSENASITLAVDILMLPADTVGITLLDDWDGMGQHVSKPDCPTSLQRAAKTKALTFVAEARTSG